MRNDLVLGKMLDIIDKIQRYCEGVSYDSFSENSLLAEACVFNLSQIGELSNKVDEEFEEQNPQIPWRQLYGLRNRIVHDYEGVNLKLVWEIIRTDLPELKEKILQLL